MTISVDDVRLESMVIISHLAVVSELFSGSATMATQTGSSLLQVATVSGSLLVAIAFGVRRLVGTIAGSDCAIAIRVRSLMGTIARGDCAVAIRVRSLIGTITGNHWAIAIVLVRLTTVLVVGTVLVEAIGSSSCSEEGCDCEFHLSFRRTKIASF